MFDDLTREGDGESAPPADLPPATPLPHDSRDATEAQLPPDTAWAQDETQPPDALDATYRDAGSPRIHGTGRL